jgi:hypothetical protein
MPAGPPPATQHVVVRIDLDIANKYRGGVCQFRDDVGADYAGCGV